MLHPALASEDDNEEDLEEDDDFNNEVDDDDELDESDEEDDYEEDDYEDDGDFKDEAESDSQGRRKRSEESFKVYTCSTITLIVIIILHLAIQRGRKMYKSAIAIVRLLMSTCIQHASCYLFDSWRSKKRNIHAQLTK